MKRKIFLVWEIIQCCLCEKQALGVENSGYNWVDFMTDYSNGGLATNEDYNEIINKYENLSKSAQKEFNKKVSALVSNNGNLLGNTGISNDYDDEIEGKIKDSFYNFCIE